MSTTFNVSRGFTYAYIHIKQASAATKSYILFLHGFPSLGYEWHYQIEHFKSLGYGIIAPDLLGYGGSSRPENVDDYRLKLMSRDVIEILDHENVQTVHAVGHDWGVALLGRLEFYYPHRIAKMAFLTIGFNDLGSSFDLEAVNSMCRDNLGYELFGYIKFFVEEPNAARIINEHLDSMTCILYAKDASLWKDHFGTVGGLKRWLLEDRRTAVLPQLTETHQRIRQRAFVEHGGYAASLMWYKALVTNISLLDEKAESCEDYKTQKPVLLITTSKDPISIAGLQVERTRLYAPELKIKDLPTGHWVHLEAKDEVNSELQQFFES